MLVWNTNAVYFQKQLEGSRTRGNKTKEKFIFVLNDFMCCSGLFLLLNHFGKPECKGDGVSVKELRGNKIQGYLATLKTTKKRKDAPTHPNK